MPEIVAPLAAVPVTDELGDRSIRQRIIEQIQKRISSDPMNRAELVRVARYLAEQPWVEVVHQVRRCGDGGVEIDARFREPAAIVEARDGYHLIDAGANRLPGVYAWEALRGLRIPVIIGVTRSSFFQTR